MDAVAVAADAAASFAALNFALAWGVNLKVKGSVRNN